MRRRLAAELLGTFGIVFAPVALSASAHFAGADGSLASAAWVSGLTVTAMIATFGSVSAHFNPAVTLGLAVVGRFAWRDVPAYIAAQVVGACLASGVALVCFGVSGAGVLRPALGVGAGQVIGIEGVLTFLLMLTIMAAVADNRLHRAVPPLSIGLVVVANVLIGGAVTGASMNPARALAPALFAGGAPLAIWWQYLVGTVGGACAAAFLYERLFRPVPDTAPAIAMPAGNATAPA